MTTIQWGGLLFLAVLFNKPANAQNWPQILGADRAGHVVKPFTSKLEWPESTKPVWRFDAGSGYAGPAVVGDTLFAFHRIRDEEILQALDIDSGKAMWDVRWAAQYGGGINPDRGPRCVPTVSGAFVVCYGAAGDLVCVDRTQAEIVWRRELGKDYLAESGYFGAGSSPLVVDDTVVTCVGGDEGGVVAVDLATGATKWTATDYKASYASPVVMERKGRKLILAVMRLNVVLIDLKDGAVLSDFKFGSRGPTVNAATPIRVGLRSYFLTASYGIGSTLVTVKTNGDVDLKYQGVDLLYSQYNTPVQFGGKVFGINGREDVGGAALRCIDPITQAVAWERRDFGVAHLLGNGASVLALSVDGRLTSFESSSERYRELRSTELPIGTYRALPALIGDKLYVRNESYFFCFQLP